MATCPRRAEPVDGATVHTAFDTVRRHLLFIAFTAVQAKWVFLPSSPESPQAP